MQQRFLILIATLFSASITTALRADHNHVHDQHPASPHSGDFERVYMNSNW